MRPSELLSTAERMATWPPLLVLTVLSVLANPVSGAPPAGETVRDGVLLLRDDNGQWGGSSMGVTHQVSPTYVARKIVDLSGVSASAWQAVQEVRLSVYFCVRDYSLPALGRTNGLDESFEIVVNGKVHTYPNNCGTPVYLEGKPMNMGWFDFALPKTEFMHGRNELLFRKAATTKPKPDDYLYLGIDNTAEHGHSSVSLDGGKQWLPQLNSIGARGEYMARLYLLAQSTPAEAVWRPGNTPPLADPARFIAYAGARRAPVSSDGVMLGDEAREARIELDQQAVDLQQPVTFVVETADSTRFAWQWLDANGHASRPAIVAGPRATLASGNRRFGGLILTATNAPLTVRSVTVQAGRNYHPVELPLEMCPAMASPAGSAARRDPVCRVTAGEIALQNADLRCRLSVRREASTSAPRLKVESLFNEWAAVEMARKAADIDFFLLEVGTNRFSGTRDFECRRVRQNGNNGFLAELRLFDPALEATLSGSIDRDGLHLGLTLANRGTQPVDFKLAFPHLAGLAVSKEPADDYYFFPRGGGIIADRPAFIRQGYGDHQALYQLIDLFSPKLGAGVSFRGKDTEGHYKILALRKTIAGRAEDRTLTPLAPTKPEFVWSNTLAQVAGTGVAFEYLRRSRSPGKSFAPPSVVITAHAGDWRGPMRHYADWAHRVWKFRPYPSRLDSVATMIAAGWGRDVLFKEGRYRDDFLKPRRDCLELMSWWEWSPLGPWSTPIDKLEEVIGKAALERWKPYFVKDPVTGQTMWNNQPGDYDGYNARFGGLPAFRDAIAQYKKSGALITLYTDPIRCDDASKLGRQHGRDWGVIGTDGQPVKSYEVWNMCHDVAEYRDWVAAAMKRVLRETGADGIRLDEYGHRGWACFNTAHRHTFAEPGCTEWQRAIAEASKLVRQAMDEVNPRSVLTTEHPGYDYLLQFLDGCITYDLTVMATPLRLLECNLQRFLFPECKAYELDHRGADPQCHKRFWNMVAAFGREYPPAMYAVLKENNEVVRSRDNEPLVPTLRPHIYANRFGSGAKTLWTLYNATGHALEEDLLAVKLSPREHLFDLLHNEPVATAAAEGQVKARVYLERNQATCVARLPLLLEASRHGDTLAVRVKSPPRGSRLVVCSPAGEELLSTAVTRPDVTLDLAAVSTRQPRCVKLLKDGQLLDATAIPTK